MEKYKRESDLVKAIQERMTKIAEEAGPADNPVIEGYMCAMRHAIDFIQATPKADVVEVVRCENCKHRNPVAYKCMRDNLWCAATDFCSHGEPRETEEQTDAS